jgi:arylsulfatase A-like enzyme
MYSLFIVGADDSGTCGHVSCTADDSASRVAMIMSGPGILPEQSVRNLVSLNDIFPTVLAMARISLPSGLDLAGRSLLPLIDGTPGGDPGRPNFITAQYHSVDSVTGMFMLRQGDLKLITFGQNVYETHETQRHFPPQLFNLSSVRVPPRIPSSHDDTRSRTTPFWRRRLIYLAKKRRQSPARPGMLVG